MRVNPTPSPIRPLARPSLEARARAQAQAPEQLAAAVAQAMAVVERDPIGLGDRLKALVERLKEALRRDPVVEPPIDEPVAEPVVPTPAPPPKPKPTPRAPFTPQPRTPFPRRTPSIEDEHQRRSEWFISQYKADSNPNEDTPNNANCGPTSLTMIAKAFGRIAPGPAQADAAIEESRRRMGKPPDEMAFTSSTDLARGARSYGLVPKTMLLRSIDGFKRQLEQGRLLIVNLIPKYLDESNNSGHFAVVTAIDKGRVYLNDPASRQGPITVSEAEFMRAVEAQGTYAAVAIRG